MKSKRSRVFNKAWKEFSKYIRTRDKNRCFTCGKTGEGMNAGHFIHQRKYPLLYFHEKNVHAQCIRCNQHLSGNLTMYALRLIQEYGEGIITELHALKRPIIKYGIYELEALWKYYKEKNKTFAIAADILKTHGVSDTAKCMESIRSNLN